jgi:hypothetical protein
MTVSRIPSFKRRMLSSTIRSRFTTPIACSIRMLMDEIARLRAFLVQLVRKEYPNFAKPVANLPATESAVQMRYWTLNCDEVYLGGVSSLPGGFSWAGGSSAPHTYTPGSPYLDSGNCRVGKSSLPAQRGFCHWPSLHLDFGHRESAGGWHVPYDR